MRRGGSGQIRCANVGDADDRHAIGLVELGGDLREQLVRRDADRRRQSGRRAHRVLDRLRERAYLGERVGLRFLARDGRGRIDVGQIDVDLVDPAVLDLRRDRGDGLLEEARIAPVRVEIDRQPDRVGRETRGLHEPHAGVDAECARLVGGGRRHAATDIIAERAERLRAHPPWRRAAAADHHGLAAELRMAQELDGRIERIHVEMGDEARSVGHDSKEAASIAAAGSAFDDARIRDARPSGRGREARVAKCASCRSRRRCPRRAYPSRARKSVRANATVRWPRGSSSAARWCSR